MQLLTMQFIKAKLIKK